MSQQGKIATELGFYDLLGDIEQHNSPDQREVFNGKVAAKFGSGNFDWFDNGGGIKTDHCQFRLSQDVIAKFVSDTSGSVIHFNLGDDIEQTFQADGYQHHYASNTFFVGAADNHFDLSMSLKQNKNYRIFMIMFSPALLQALTETEMESKNLWGASLIQTAHQHSYAMQDGGSIDAHQRHLIEAIYSEGQQPSLMQQILTEARVLELIHYSIRKIDMRKQNSLLSTELSSERVALLERAKCILLQSLAHPPSIKALAKLSGTNELYLKQGFKQFYGDTVFGVLRNHRMELAKTLLEQDDTSIKEVARKLGFKHQGHFSKLFQRKFGVQPSEVLRKNRSLQGE